MSSSSSLGGPLEGVESSLKSLSVEQLKTLLVCSWNIYCSLCIPCSDEFACIFRMMKRRSKASLRRRFQW